MRSKNALIYKQVTEEITTQLKKGTKPWEAPWKNGDPWPRNGKTLRPYLGINVLILWSAYMNAGYGTQRWLTERQAVSIGGVLKDDERGTTIFFGGTGYRNKGYPSSRRPISVRYGFERHYTVYNLDQFLGLPPQPTPQPGPHYISERADALIAATGADIRVGGSRAFYDPGGDHIQVPCRSAYFQSVNYYRTIFHELGHWTKHHTRLDRKIPGDHKLAEYAWEEIVGELVAAYLIAALDIVPTVRSADYIAEWLRVLKLDEQAVSRAAPHARNAADHLLSFAPSSN
ncbi:MAG: DUF1738 domain-containing protein [Rhodospirillaceae bacterium]|nr:MAG: DUF1738 domain-containing protein [Rhodospirillaceae bacterium]